MQGVLSPVVTPFDRELRPDGERLVNHCRWLLEQGVGLAVFGTNSEANSMSVAEKIALLDQLIAAGVPPARMMPGTGACAFPDTVELIPLPGSLDHVLVLALRPFLARCAEVLRQRTPLTETHALCPFCGWEPDFAVIMPSAERQLICGRCTAQDGSAFLSVMERMAESAREIDNSRNVH